jgi:hypothetical protein
MVKRGPRLRPTVSAGVDTASIPHKRFQPRLGLLAARNVPQRPRPFADRLIIRLPLTRAAHDSTERVSVFVEWKMSKFECVPHQSVSSPS